MPGRLPRRDLVHVDELKALAHPLRQRILYHLAFVGSASSTSVAEAFGESTGSTSYHLRQLARFGLVEEDPERTRGRERWWRIVPLDLRAIPRDEGGEHVTGHLRRIRLERDRALVDRYLANRHQFGTLAEAAMFSSSALHLTEDELRQLTEEYVALIQRWWRPAGEGPDDAVPVSLLFYAFPWPGE
jgi:DNA-binding transcriptional ArsR family regulator